MSHNKGSSPKYRGRGSVQHLAKDIQANFKVAYAIAVDRAHVELGLLQAKIGATPTLLSVVFADLSIPNGNGTIDTWAWDFGDGNTDTIEAPTNVYAEAGTYVVSLKVTTDTDFTDTGYLRLTVAA